MLEYRLVSVPELGYTIHDKPYPRGELQVKTKAMIVGWVQVHAWAVKMGIGRKAENVIVYHRYYKDPVNSLELINEDGFAPTGDIMEERRPGVFYWCDRVKNILKLAQGEFVSLWRLEAFYMANPYIHQVKQCPHSSGRLFRGYLCNGGFYYFVLL